MVRSYSIGVEHNALLRQVKAIMVSAGDKWMDLSCGRIRAVIEQELDVEIDGPAKSATGSAHHSTLSLPTQTLTCTVSPERCMKRMHRLALLF